MEQDMDLNRASRNPSSSSSSSSHICLMARDSKVTRTSPNISNDDDDSDDGDIEEEDDTSIREKGEIVFHALRKNKIASSNFIEIMTIAIECKKHFEELEARDEEQEDVIEKLQDLANDLRESLEEEQTTKESLEETFALELSRIKESHDRAFEVANDFKTKNEKLQVDHAKLLEDFEHLENGSRVIKSELIKLTESHAQLKASYSKEISKMSSPIVSNDDACATNSICFEASILKENVELKAQLALLSSKYEKLVESHEKLSSSHDNLLVSHDELKIAHEACSSKVTSCEPHVDISTIFQNAILPCASPSSSSTHDIAKSCDELLALPCCSNNEASTSPSSCVVTNHVGKINELKAQVTSLKKDLVKSHKGKATLDKVLSVQKSPNDKRGLGFKSNIKNKSKINKKIKKKGQEQVKDSANIICFKCKVEGHHVRSCPLKKKKSLNEKQQGKRPQVQGQAHAQPQVKERPPPKAQAIALQVKNSMEKSKKSRCCYLCRKKGHFASSCTSGTSSNPIIVDNVYSLGKDKVGNVFAKYIGTQSGFKKRTIWVAKPIVTNILGPNIVGDQQALT
jgi:hypothetical protein